MEKYKCDICQDLYNENDYYEYNSIYGYCDKLKCKEIAENKLSSDIYNCLSASDFKAASDLIGDRCLTEIIK